MNKVVFLGGCGVVIAGLIGCGSTQPVTQEEEPVVVNDQVDEQEVEEEVDFPNPPVAEGAFRAKIPPSSVDVQRFTTDLGEGTLRAKLTTSKGEITCELFEETAPVTVANFVGLARGLKAWTMPESGEAMLETPLYNGVLCHRVIPNFMIQCGDPSGTGMGNPGYTIPDEFASGLKHDKPGLLSMANAGPGTGGSQFFVTEVPTPHLNNRHTIFGQCEEVETVKKIARVDRAAQDRPVNDVVIEKIEVYRGDKK